LKEITVVKAGSELFVAWAGADVTPGNDRQVIAAAL
jgi:hypothetical protein